MGLLRKLRSVFGEAARFAVLLAVFAFSPGAAPPARAGAAPEPLIPIVGEPMRFVHVVGADPRCQPNCPEWVSADGPIAVGTAQAFARFIAGLGGRRLPILINSRGGSMPDAIAMGRLIRARRLAVVVARTDLAPCPSGQPRCDPVPGVVKLAQSICLSACPVVLAGGVERYVSGLSAIGVHQVRIGPKTLVKRVYQVQYRIVGGQKQEISRTLTSEERSVVAPTSVDLTAVDATVAKYLAEMGIGDLIVKSMLSTPPSGMDLLTNAELVSSRLATQWLLEAPFAPADGPDGLNGAPAATSSIQSSTSSSTFVVAATGRGAIDGRPAEIRGDFQYRRGGGTVFASFALADPAPAVSPTAAPTPTGKFSISVAKSASLAFEEKNPGGGAAGRIPLRDFCRLRATPLAIVVSEPSSAAGAAISIDVAKAPEAAALFDEACPPGAFASR